MGSESQVVMTDSVMLRDTGAVQTHVEEDVPTVSV